jgi:hypothetical protein
MLHRGEVLVRRSAGQLVRTVKLPSGGIIRATRNRLSMRDITS